MLRPIIARSKTLSCDVRGGVEGKSINGDENRATRARSPHLGSCHCLGHVAVKPASQKTAQCQDRFACAQSCGGPRIQERRRQVIHSSAFIPLPQTFASSFFISSFERTHVP